MESPQVPQATCSHLLLLCAIISVSLTLPLSSPAQEKLQETPEEISRQVNPGGVNLPEPRFGFLYRQNPSIGVFEPVQWTEPPPLLNVGTLQNFFYTDNAFLTDHNRQPSLGWDGSLYASVVPWSTYRWIPSINYQHDFFRFGRESLRDFDSDILGLNSNLYLSDDRAWSWNANYSLWRYYSSRLDQGEFFKFGELDNRLNWRGAWSRDAPLSWLVSYGVTWRLSSPSEFDRLATDLSGSLFYYPLPQLEIGAFVIPDLRYYSRDTAQVRNRKDFNLLTGISATWYFNPYFSLGCGFNWAGNYSNTDTFSYESLTPTLSLGGHISF